MREEQKLGSPSLQNRKSKIENFAERIIAFNRALDFDGPLPDGIRVMNPFRENEAVLPVSSAFYRKFYSDNHPRHLILGINPGRFGAGSTGIPFTDTKRLADPCGLAYRGKPTHEPSSVFVYEVIEAYGGVETFYRDFYINSVVPLGFTIVDENGKEKNYNYYDSKALTAAVYDYSVDNIRQQIALGVETDICYCFGTGKNEQFLRSLNQTYGFFGEIVALEHPRFIMQYRAKSKQLYIDKYVEAFRRIQKDKVERIKMNSRDLRESFLPESNPFSYEILCAILCGLCV